MGADGLASRIRVQLAARRAYVELERAYARDYRGMSYEQYRELMTAILPENTLIVFGAAGEEIVDVAMVQTALENGWTIDQLHTALQGGTHDATELYKQVFRRNRIAHALVFRERRGRLMPTPVVRRHDRRPGPRGRRLVRRARARAPTRLSSDDPPHSDLVLLAGVVA